MESKEQYQNKWLIMAAIGSGILLATIDGSIVNITLPTLIQTFDTTFPVVQWVVLSYLLVITTLILGMGRLGDILGKKSVHRLGLILFTIGSMLCGLAPSVYALIAFRALQAIGASMTMAMGVAIITESFPREERGKALGIAGAIVSAGIITGPVIGGLILGALSWRWIFYVNVPVGIIGVWMVTRYVVSQKPPGGQRFDFIGALILFISLSGLLLALTLGQDIGFTNPLILGLLGVFFLFIAVFIWVETRVSQPMIDLTLFKNTLFSANLVMGVLVFISLAGTTIMLPFYLEDVRGYSPQTVGLLLSVVPIMLGITSPITGSLSDRYGSRPVLTIGLALLLAGYITVTQFLQVDTSMLVYILMFIPIGIGFGTFQSPNNSAVMGAVPKERLGITSGLLSISRTMGQTIGIAVLGAFFAGQVAAQLGGELPAGGATAASPIVEAIALRNTFYLPVVLVGIALVIGVWGWMRERRQISQVQPATD